MAKSKSNRKNILAENYISWIVCGALAGWIMSVMLPQKGTHNLRSDITIGITSSLFSGILLQLLIIHALNKYDYSVLIFSFMGAMVALATHRTFARTQ